MKNNKGEREELTATERKFGWRCAARIRVALPWSSSGLMARGCTGLRCGSLRSGWRSRRWIMRGLHREELGTAE